MGYEGNDVNRAVSRSKARIAGLKSPCGPFIKYFWKTELLAGDLNRTGGSGIRSTGRKNGIFEIRFHFGHGGMRRLVYGRMRREKGLGDQALRYGGGFGVRGQYR